MTAKKITLTLPENEANHLNELAKSLHMKKTELIREALAMYQDYLELSVVKKRLHDIESKKSEIVSFEELERKVYAD